MSNYGRRAPAFLQELTNGQLGYKNQMTGEDIELPHFVRDSLGRIVSITGVQRVLDLPVPTTGQTVSMQSNPQYGGMWIDPATTLAALTIVLPLEKDSQLMQERFVGSSKTITALTVTGATPIYTAPTTLSPGDVVTFIKLAPNVWARKS